MREAKRPSQEQIEQRAYELYLDRGGEHGRHTEDWLAAEEELTNLALADASWAGTELAVDEELDASDDPAEEEPAPRKKSASAAAMSKFLARVPAT